MEAPEGFEGEGVASYLNKTGVVDAVFSGDTDSIAYGAKKLFRRVPIKKAIYEYTYDDIMDQVKEKNDDLAKYDIDLLIKCALIMGTDFCEKTPGIGPKTVFKKIEYIDLTPEQEKAFIEFKKEPDMSKVIKSTESASNKEELINWLVNERQFDKTRITKKLEFIDYTKLYKKVTKPATRVKENAPEKQKIVKRTLKPTK
jgi:flap endonuclease-1